ncbi:unnamed protein product, partial [Prorocentrum cordatum]
ALWIALEGVAQGPLARAASKRERGGRKGSRLSSVVSLNARPARESFAGASGVDAGNGTSVCEFSGSS